MANRATLRRRAASLRAALIDFIAPIVVISLGALIGTIVVIALRSGLGALIGGPALGSGLGALIGAGLLYPLIDGPARGSVFGALIGACVVFYFGLAASTIFFGFFGILSIGILLCSILDK